MNYSFVLYILSKVTWFQALFLAIPCLVAIIYGEEKCVFAYFVVMLGCFIIGLLGRLLKPNKKSFFAKEGFVTVSLSWVVLSLTGALPFVISGDIPSYTDALFETISGFTTTGASILSDVEALSYSNLFWRSFTHWIGGMGVLVFILTVLPLAGGYNMHLMRAESPGPSVGKLVPRIKSTARILYGIYFAMTVVFIIILLITGMDLFSSITIAFGTAGTGGFAILNSSIASYPLASQIAITIGMILFGVNFSVYYLILIRKPKEALKHQEARYYLLIILAAIALIAWNIRDQFDSIFMAIHQAAFQVGSIITTTGYATTDFNLWPAFSQTILIFLMFIGACAGSTGGGIKVSRIVILLKLIKNEIYYLLHPNRVRQVRLENEIIPKEIFRAIQAFLVTYLVIFATSVLLISTCGFDFNTNFTAVASALNNIGPGLGLVGPTGNFGIYSGFAKYVLMFDMLAGRLEIFPLLVLCSPITWKR